MTSLKKQVKKMVNDINDLEEQLAEKESKNQELIYQWQDAQDIAKDDGMMHQMIMREQNELVERLKEELENNKKKRQT